MQGLAAGFQDNLSVQFLTGLMGFYVRHGKIFFKLTLETKNSLIVLIMIYNLGTAFQKSNFSSNFTLHRIGNKSFATWRPVIVSGLVQAFLFPLFLLRLQSNAICTHLVSPWIYLICNSCLTFTFLIYFVLNTAHMLNQEDASF